MSRRTPHIKKIFFFLSFILSAVGSLGIAQQCSGESGPTTTPIDTLIQRMSLNAYEAAAGDLSLCADDAICLKHAKMLKSALCSADACESTDSTKEPTACWEGTFDDYTISAKAEAAAALCSWIKSPSPQTRQVVLMNMPNPPGQDKTIEDDLVIAGAEILALKGSAAACENNIKKFVGDYGPKWKYRWYRAMSGCRILAHERTLQQEEQDFSTWIGVIRGLGNCSDIVNIEMRNACSAPGATSPILEDQE